MPMPGRSKGTSQGITILLKELTLLVAGRSGGGAVGAGGASEGGISDVSHSPLRRSGPGLSPWNNKELLTGPIKLLPCPVAK